MSLELSPCQNADMSRVFELVSLSFGHQHPYIEAVFPEHDTPAGRKAGAERLLSAKLNDPVASFHKVVDTATGDIIATARWNIYDNIVPEEVLTLPASYFQDIEAKEYAEYMFTEYLKPRRNAIRQSGGHLLSLDLMCVDPKQQRRGAGKILVQWGVNMADKLGVEAVVEASNEGRGLYEKFGFILEEAITMENPKKQAANPKQSFFWMRRPAVKSQITKWRAPLLSQNADTK